MRRIEALARRVAKLEGARGATDDPLALVLKAIDGKTKGRLPSEFYGVDRRPDLGRSAGGPCPAIGDRGPAQSNGAARLQDAT